MSKFEAAIEEYKAKIGSCDEDLLRKVTKGLGPSIYLKDASMVSCSDQTELDRVKNNFLKKKHGMSDEAKMDNAIAAVCEKMKGDRQKKRAIFYYHLVKDLGLAGNY